MSKNPSQGIPVIGPLLAKIIGTRNERFVKRYTQRVQAISAFEPEMRKLTDDELKAKTDELRAKAADGAKADQLMPEAFAVAREAMDRAVGIRNIFNPVHEFDPTTLPEHAQALYHETKKKMDETPSLIPLTSITLTRDQERDRELLFKAREAEDALGSVEEIPGWRQVPIPNELYEAVRELYPESRPPFRARPFDVQLIGGMVLYGGKIAEMKTGEGKTIVAPLACYLAAIEGLKVNVVTVNDYLVQRDRDWTFPFFYSVGLTVGAIHPQHSQPEYVKREMYRCDVVYGTTSEFGFDYLRDNMKRSADQQVQRVREFAIVDEVDSTLIDEARTPLIISGEAHDDQPRYDLADGLAQYLLQMQKPWQDLDERVQKCLERIKGLEGDMRNTRDKGAVPELDTQLEKAKKELPELELERDKNTKYYEIERDRKQVYLTHEGIAEAQRKAGIGSFYVGGNMDIPHLLEQALRGYAVYERDKDYIVMPVENPQTGQAEPSVVIVDTFTGRPMIGRQWSDGLHQAIECKERVPIKQETQTVATITIQNFFKMYKRLAGMTGTADTEAQEFHDIYKLDVVAIPTNKPVIRADYDDMMFLTAKDKWEFIVDEIKAFHDVGRPVLVGTTSVERSEVLSQMLERKHGIKHNVLNAKQHEREALVIEDAGHLGSVMIATNMAGRGTDIRLGPISRETLLDHWLRRGLCSRELKPDATVEQLRENVYRKIAPRELDLKELGLNRRDLESMDFDELELLLLRTWAINNTLMSEKKISGMTADALRETLDRTGRILLHRIDWFDTIEEMGGLHVIGTERHESRRIDNQLRGRSGRQGDKGSTRFFVSCEDDLMKMFAGETMLKLLPKLGFKEGDSIESSMLSKRIEGAQRKVEERNFYARKNLLEMDEVYEHQRQSFYGVRQQVIEGREVKGLIFGYIGDAVGEAVGRYLSKGYPAECAAEAANNLLESQVAPERLKGRDFDEMVDRIRADAKQDARSAIGVTLGEYMPDAASEVEVDFDAAGLRSWAKEHFDVDLDVEELHAMGFAGRREIENRLCDAAEERIDAADLSDLERFCATNYGAQELVAWSDKKFGIKFETEEVAKMHTDGGDDAVEDAILDQAEGLYEKREAEYPVEFAMDMAMALMRQSPQQGAEQLVTWANRRFDMGWNADTLKTMQPQQAKDKLLEASRQWIEDGQLGKLSDHAAGLASNDDKLTKFFETRLGQEVPFDISRLPAEEREQPIRSAVESALRAELLFLERTLLLNNFDSTWKEHLYAMDQLRGAIGFRSFAQQDYRIEFKREGSRLFGDMLSNIRDRVTDHVFKLKLTPRINPQQAAPAQQQAPQVQTVQQPVRTGTSADMYPADGKAATAASGAAAGGIVGPGIEGGQRAAVAQPAPPAPAPAPVERDERLTETSRRAGSAPPKPAGKAATPREKKVGRNDPCPCGSGKKYKKCCGAAQSV